MLLLGGKEINEKMKTQIVHKNGFSVYFNFITNQKHEKGKKDHDGSCFLLLKQFIYMYSSHLLHFHRGISSH